MLTSEFDYYLPPERIAQHPIEPRDLSRLLVLRRGERFLEHRRFRDITDYLRPGDLIVANTSRVIPARLQARKVPSGGRVELLLVARHGPTRWEALVKGRRAAVGQRLEMVPPEEEGGPEAEAPILATVEAVAESGGRILAFDRPVEPHLPRLGVVPLPPYIHEPLADADRYQTVYAREDGSVAAPTAGLHFTPELMARTQAMGVEWAWVVLHIGLDTFRPVTAERIADHHIHTEYGHLGPETAERIRRARERGGRIIALGTTSVRVLETAARRAPEGDGPVAPWQGPTDLFIYPGHRYQAVDALITNFHLPRSSLLMLVAAFCGLPTLRHAYSEAVRLQYGFFSFGDAMLIL